MLEIERKNRERVILRTETYGKKRRERDCSVDLCFSLTPSETWGFSGAWTLKMLEREKTAVN